MESSELNRRLKKLGEETGWSLENLTGFWQSIVSLNQRERARLTPDFLAPLFNISPEDAFRLLLGCTKVGLLRQNWQVFNSVTGWVLHEAASLSELSGEKVLDPFTQEQIEPDLENSVCVTFAPALGLFADCPKVYSGTWEDYRLFRHVGLSTEADVLLDAPRHFKVFSPWELGKIELRGSPGEMYQLVCLETRSTFLLKIGGTPVLHGESFMEKMVSYKSVKAQEVSGYQTLDLRLSPTGFEESGGELRPGKIILWVENRSGHSVAIQTWKSPINFPHVQQRKFFKGRSLLNHEGFRKSLANENLPIRFHMKVTGQAFLFVDFKKSEELFHNWGDAESFRALKEAEDRIVQAIQKHGGFVFKKVSETTLASFPSPQSAVFAALEMQSIFPQSDDTVALRIRLALYSGSVLLVNGLGGLDFFGYAVNMGLLLLEHAQLSELWISLGIFTSQGIVDHLIQEGYECVQELIALKGDDQKSLAYRCIRRA